MKERNFCRLVYRMEKDGIFRRSNGNTFLYDFPNLPTIGKILRDYRNQEIFIIKVSFTFQGNKALAWMDKHDNIIVRYFPYKQTKIDF